MTLSRETLTYHRALRASPARTYDALVDPKARKVWGTPGAGYSYQTGSDAPPEPGQREIGKIIGGEEGETDIITDWILLEPGARVTYAEALAHGGMTLGLSFAEAELTETDQGCDLDLVVHVTSYLGPEVVAEMQAGWDHAMQAFALYLTENQAA